MKLATRLGCMTLPLALALLGGGCSDASKTDATAQSPALPATAAAAAAPDTAPASESVAPAPAAGTEPIFTPVATTDDGTQYFLTPAQLAAGEKHERHLELFGADITGYNRAILAGIDRVQATAPDGGGYFIGVKAIPAESPIGYDITLFNRPLLAAPRTTSYCSGSSYSAFIEGMNILFPDGATRISEDRYESLRMQEPDGGRREDLVKFWGNWNADGFGNHFALVQYSQMGEVISPERARPGDFMNISWTSGSGHAVVFLGWVKPADAPNGEPSLRYWSSQASTNGLSDQVVPLKRISSVKVVRLTNPERVFEFDPKTTVNTKIPGDKVRMALGN